MNKLSKIEVFSIALGSIIGWGAFMLPGIKFLKEAGIINTFLGLLLGAVSILIIESSYKYMIAHHNEEGGEFSFTYQHLGNKHGFISGWFLGLAYLSIIPLNATALPLVIDKLFSGYFQKGYLYNILGYNVYLGEVIVSSIVILFFAWINLKGLKKVGKIQSFCTLFLIGIVFFIAILMFIKVPIDFEYKTYIESYTFDLKQIFAIFVIAPWAYIGFDTVPQLVKNFDFPREMSSALSMFAILFGLLIYTLLTAITGLVFSPSELINFSWPTGEAVLSSLGSIPFVLLCTALFFAVCSGVNGFFVSTTKLLNSMSEYKVLPFKEDTKQVIYFITVISLVAPWFGREALGSIVDMASVGAAISYSYVCYIVWRETKKVTAILGLIICIIFILLLLLFPGSPSFLSTYSIIALIIWIIIGSIYYYQTLRK